MNWRHLACAATVFAVASCEGYRDHELELRVAMRAKEHCSCLFVSRAPPVACQQLTASEPPLVTVTVDPTARVVEAQSLLLWSARARYTDEHTGCVLE